ncbi:hypothetical protein OX284_007225 [Flavobacterium sp. SUN046]|uniref:hypothetical protein n=1 Tax=Flavobacterium sp. SUN046 TaxID=3002440 RepID=UPI002DB88044|nr:hypothetical protein [Flavobacterium sp. SUN046]MEC4049216.1 hypothetical protein [Flavobacterium sp. SUN046]
MQKKDLFIGFIIGLVAATLGAYIMVESLTHYNLFTDYKKLQEEELLGKVITLGSILNIILFFVLIKKNKELMARGIVLATIILTLFTMFI